MTSPNGPAGGGPRAASAADAAGDAPPAGGTPPAPWRETAPRGSWRELDHPADVYLELRAPDLSGLYETGLRALYSLMVEPAGVRPARPLLLSAEGADAADTLRALVAEALYAFAARGFVAAAGRLLRAEPQCAQAELWGEAYEMGRHEPLLEVKAVTYHLLTADRLPAAGASDDGAAAGPAGGGWRATLLLDV